MRVYHLGSHLLRDFGRMLYVERLLAAAAVSRVAYCIERKRRIMTGAGGGGRWGGGCADAVDAMKFNLNGPSLFHVV